MNELVVQGKIDASGCYIDAPFVNGCGGDLEIGKAKCGKAMKIMAIVDRSGLPLSLSTHAANHHEVKLVQLLNFHKVKSHINVSGC